jgi:hypothetical protein
VQVISNADSITVCPSVCFISEIYQRIPGSALKDPLLTTEAGKNKKINSVLVFTAAKAT